MTLVTRPAAFSIGTFLLVFLLGTGCATVQKPVEPTFPKVEQSPPGEVTRQKEPDNISTSEEAPPSAPPNWTAMRESLLAGVPLSRAQADEIRGMAGKMGDNPAAKAAAALWALDQAERYPNLLTAESMANDLGLDLVQIVQENPLLDRPIFVQKVFTTLQHSADSDTYKMSLYKALKHRVVPWIKVAKLMGALDSTASATEEETDPAGETVAEEDGTQSPSDFRNDDTLLVDAESFAGKGDFAKAIELARQVRPDSPLASFAEEKVKAFSNAAVQDLRQKAAHAYQSSLPLTDQMVKQGYLQKAKEYLETALERYPQAEQIHVVKENLSVILSSLERVNSSVSGQGH